MGKVKDFFAVSAFSIVAILLFLCIMGVIPFSIWLRTTHVKPSLSVPLLYANSRLAKQLHLTDDELSMAVKVAKVEPAGELIIEENASGSYKHVENLWNEEAVKKIKIAIDSTDVRVIRVERILKEHNIGPKD